MPLDALPLLSATPAGGVCELPPGDYARIVTGRAAVRDVQTVVRPAVAGTVTIAGAALNGWQGWSFEGITFTGDVAASQAKHVTLERCVFPPPRPDWENGAAKAISLVAVEDFAVVDCEIDGWGIGISVAGIAAVKEVLAVAATGTTPAVKAVKPRDTTWCNRVRIKGNTIRHIAVDGIRGLAWTQGVVIEDNRLLDFAKNDKAHKDAIQGFKGEARNLTIRRNTYDGRNTGGRRQFIFLQLTLVDVEITDNFAFGAGPWGVAVDGAQSGLIRDNYCVPFIGYGAKNVAPNSGPDLVFENNVTAPAVLAGDPAAGAAFDLRYQTWLHRNDPPAAPPTLEERVAALEAWRATFAK